MSLLNDDTFLEIIKKTDITDLKSVCETNREFRAYCKSNRDFILGIYMKRYNVPKGACNCLKLIKSFAEKRAFLYTSFREVGKRRRNNPYYIRDVLGFDSYKHFKAVQDSYIDNCSYDDIIFLYHLITSNLRYEPISGQDGNEDAVKYVHVNRSGEISLSKAY